LLQGHISVASFRFGEAFRKVISLSDGSGRQVTRDPQQTMWRGLPEDLEDTYKAKLGENIVFWNFTSTTTSMAALDPFIPVDSPQERCADMSPVSCMSGKVLWSV
jgi:hypothetical protein